MFISINLWILWFIFYHDADIMWISPNVKVKQKPRKLSGFYWIEDRFWPNFADTEHGYTQEFYWSYWSFISNRPSTVLRFTSQRWRHNDFNQGINFYSIMIIIKCFTAFDYYHDRIEIDTLIKCSKLQKLSKLQWNPTHSSEEQCECLALGAGESDGRAQSIEEGVLLGCVHLVNGDVSDMES